MTRDLWLLIVLLITAVWLGAHDHRLGDNEPIIFNAQDALGEGDKSITESLGL